ncbi:MAG: hypothetical protein ER33_07050 [Cyanobium sp. CACIAM 14]|nr:MAG: hypothetical protein ER33_07050 [Cyanobium sp. CACIAM 14]
MALTWKSLRDEVMNENHPVYQSLLSMLWTLREQYRHHPSEQSRYRMVRMEQLIAQWAPGAPASDLQP